MILVDLSMAFTVENMAVGLPFIAEPVATGIVVWDLFLEMNGTGLRPIPNPIRSNLACPAIQGQPQPALMHF